MAYKFVGKSVPRIEGAEKVSGKMRYAADVDIPDALWAKLLRTSLPHARILRSRHFEGSETTGRPRGDHWRRYHRRF